MVRNGSWESPIPAPRRGSFTPSTWPSSSGSLAGLSCLVGREVRNLRELSDTVVLAGVAVEDTGDLLVTLDDVPFIGGRVGEVAKEVREAGASARESGRESRDSTDDLSVLLALSIGLIPTLPPGSTRRCGSPGRGMQQSAALRRTARPTRP